MPDNDMEDAIKEAYAVAPSEIIVLHTIEIRHASFATPIRVVRNFADPERWAALGGSGVEAVLDAMEDDARAMVGLVARLEASAPANGGEYVPFVALAFDFELPPVENVPMPEIMLTMDNVGREISDQLEAAAQSTSEIFVTYRPFNSNDIEKPQIRNPITLTLSDVEADVQRVVGRASMLNIGNKSWPALVYTARQFPGLAR